VDVKISDFSYAKTVTYPNALKTQCGTEGYVAPEVLKHRPAYDVQCDMWTVGVIVFIMLGGYRPFRGDSEEEILKNIRYGEYKFIKKYWKKVSEEAKTLIRGMLTVDVEKRVTADEALKSRWIQGDVARLSTDLTGNIYQLTELRSKFKGAVQTLIATSKFHESMDQLPELSDEE
jgi:calcium-dependent protein kinase